MDHLAGLSAERLAGRLREALAVHDLDRRELVAAQRDVTRLQRIGALPSPNEYWQRTALPRAALLIDSSMSAVVEEGHRLGEAIDGLLSAVDDYTRTPDQPTSAPNRPACDRPALDRAGVALAEQAIVRLVDAVPSSRSIDALGCWWQRRLRRAAIVGSLPGLLTSKDADRMIGQAEMALLDRPPWSHGDRLLSAFELAHGEIRTQTELVVEGLSSRVVGRGRRFLSPGERVTIELRS